MTRTSITFLGGVRTVTGSRFLVRTPDATVLVDCGLFQGRKELRERNWRPLTAGGDPLDPAGIDAVVLTHAHIDHSGWLPRLRDEGFRGPIWCTAGTAALCGIVLPDAGHLQEEEANYAARVGSSKHRVPLPLFTEDSARAVLEQFRTARFSRPFTVAPGVEVRLHRAGHILGSAFAELRVAGGPTIVVSGDLGRPSHPLLLPPEPPPPCDALLVESTYGGREHEEVDPADVIADAVQRTVARGGSIVVPAFAVDRTEVLLHHLARLAQAGRLPDVPVYVDSPLALAALEVYRRVAADGADDLRPEATARLDPGRYLDLTEVPDVEGSKRLNTTPFPSVIISASGMATGGRVVHHLAHRLPDPRTTVLLGGYQAEGTRGRALADGARELKMLGGYVRVRAEVVTVPALSVHADQSELLDWVDGAVRGPGTVYVVHGEEEGAMALAGALERRIDVPCVVPQVGERVLVHAAR
jgi:metallo-beta-lactamase family protein